MANSPTIKTRQSSCGTGSIVCMISATSTTFSWPRTWPVTRWLSEPVVVVGSVLTATVASDERRHSSVWTAGVLFFPSSLLTEGHVLWTTSRSRRPLLYRRQRHSGHLCIQLFDLLPTSNHVYWKRLMDSYDIYQTSQFLAANGKRLVHLLYPLVGKFWPINQCQPLPSLLATGN